MKILFLAGITKKQSFNCVGMLKTPDKYEIPTSFYPAFVLKVKCTNS